MEKYRTCREGIRSSGYASANIVAYYPRVVPRSDPAGEARVAGAVLAGLLCKIDRLHGAWEELDQIGFGISRNMLPAENLAIADAQLLVREGLNVIAGKTAGRAAFCGSVTLGRGGQMDRRYASLTVRRLCLSITNAIERSTRWALFEPDGTRVGERLLGQVDGYMSGLANRGAFEYDRFAVNCETELHSKTTDPERGFSIMLAFRPSGSDEDISLTLHHTIAGCRVAATAFAQVAAEVA